MARKPEDDRVEDLNAIFDLDRKGLTKKLVADMEQCLHDRLTAGENLRAVVAAARESQFSARDVAAMKRLAKWRLDDKLGTAREELDALWRVSDAIGVDLFGEPGE